MAAGGVGGQCRGVRGSHRVRAVSTWQFGSYNCVTHSPRRRCRGVRPCGRCERSRDSGRLKLSSLTPPGACGLAIADRNPGLRNSASCGSFTGSKTAPRLGGWFIPGLKTINLLTTSLHLYLYLRSSPTADGVFPSSHLEGSNCLFFLDAVRPEI